ncbi:hypothetical protein [Cellulomonas rhizosphaerae]|uniref:Uncharacterized protein n=1 Tax=Cellulomonas rhizosphaerae TaxID=2293719 RepID=A0A413RIV9_9CELL|nr:hypothetical protein [Cellulomonas rhizosphaerae]RHA38390.1 hypothetical protein D1825_14030 [Cellulomonas rhizosphaerae]
MSTTPEARLATGATVPATLLRAVLGVVVAAMVVVGWAADRDLLAAVVVVALGLGVFVALRPWSVVTAVCAGLAGFLVLVGGAASLPTVMLLVLLVHLATWGSALAARTSWRGRVEVAVVLDGLRSVARVQVGAQVLAVVAVLLAGADLGAADVWRAAAMLAAIGVAVLALPRSPSAG